MLSGVSEKAFFHHLKMLNIRIDEFAAPAGCLHGKNLSIRQRLVKTIERLLRCNGVELPSD